MGEPDAQQADQGQGAPEESGGVSLVGNAPIAEPEGRQVERPAAPPVVASKREDARKNIAYVLLAVFICQLAFLGYAAFGTDETWSRAQEFMQITLAGTLGLLGSAIGFYYGSQR